MKKGFSLAAAQVMLTSHRASTRRLYDLKWNSFLAFCRARRKDARQPDLPFLAEFLIHLRTSRHLSGATISTYLSGISSVWAKLTSKPVSRSPELLAIIKSFKLEDQRKKFRPPAWDLNVVLRHLISAAFEPLASSDIAALTFKTVFLLALATAARVGELHAIDVTRITFDVGADHKVHLGLLLDFVAKNQLVGQEGRTFHLAPLSNLVGPHDREDLSLCPVRALRCYLDRTASFRRQRKRLFLPLSPTSTAEVSKNTLSLWLRTAILRAYTAAGLPAPSSSRPHEIRAVAASMALHANIAVADIVKGCFWAGDSTFANYYLRDVAVQDVQGLHSFGPLVLAQQLVNSQSRRRF